VQQVFTAPWNCLCHEERGMTILVVGLALLVAAGAAGWWAWKRAMGPATTFRGEPRAAGALGCHVPGRDGQPACQRGAPR
jgi:hypothetical protein